MKESDQETAVSGNQSLMGLFFVVDACKGFKATVVIVHESLRNSVKQAVGASKTGSVLEAVAG